MPPKIHKQTKAETYTIEGYKGYNSLLRHLLARMRRKTKCYSKCIKRLEYSISCSIPVINVLDLLLGRRIPEQQRFDIYSKVLRTNF